MDMKNFSSFMVLEDKSTLLGELPHKLRNKILKWKPSELETTLLKMYFQNNGRPTIEEKESLIKNFAVRFNSQVNIAQLTQWFKNEREKISKKHEKEPGKIIYRKFKQEELDYLNQSFIEDNYPRLDTMTAMAKQMDCTLSKIENWYKHNRRMLAKEGSMILKTKKYFKNEELSYLLDLYNQNTCPNKKQMIEIAGKLNCDKYQIKNWYSNRRKKFRQLRKDEPENHKAQPFQTNNKIDSASFELYQSSPESSKNSPFTPPLNTENSSFEPQNQAHRNLSLQEIPTSLNIQNLRAPETYSFVPQNIYNSTNLQTGNVQVANFYPHLNIMNAPFMISPSAHQSPYYSIANQNSVFGPQNHTFSFPIQMISHPRFRDPAMSNYAAVTNAIHNESFDDLGEPKKRLVIVRPSVEYVLLINQNPY